jgi:hypothetical protein
LSYNHSLKQIIAFAQCPRSWAAKNLFKCDDPKNAFAQDGIDAHNACKAWLRTGKFDYSERTRDAAGNWGERFVACPPESHIGRLASAAVAYAPQGALPEMDQSFTLFDRSVECHIDCLWPDWTKFADWKFTSGSSRDLTQATLPTDMQANFQSYGMMKGSSQLSIEGLWVYVSKKTYRPKPLLHGFSFSGTEAYLRQHALPIMQLIEMFADLHAQGRLTSVQQIPHDITACDGTGRFCNFLGQCKMWPSTGASLIQIRRHQKGNP